MMELNDIISGEHYKTESLSPHRSGIYNTRNELEEKFVEFKDYIVKSKELYIRKRINRIDTKILKRFFKKFNDAFNNWKEDLEKKGSVSFYIGRVLDALYLGLWDFDYVNDPNGALSPFGPYLFQLLEIHRHRRIGIIHAFEQQQYHPHYKNLIGAQALSNEIFRTFFPGHFAGYYWPVVHFSSGQPAAFFSNQYTPTIITLDKTKTENHEDFSALPHECGHAISGTRLGRELLETIEKKVSNFYISKGNVDLYNKYWKWWLEECFADAVAVAVLGEAEIVSLAQLFNQSDIDRIYRNSRHLRVDEHPNRYIRILVAIEVAKKLNVDENVLQNCITQWEAFTKTKNRDQNLVNIRDEFEHKFVSVSDFESGIEFVAKELVNTEYLCGTNKQTKGKNIKKLADVIKEKITDENLLEDETDAYNFLKDLKNAIKKKKNKVINICALN